MSETDLLEEIEYLRAKLYKINAEKTQLKRQVDTLSQENRDLRTLNTEYTQLLTDKPISRSKLQETIRIQADQIAGLQHDLEVQRITSKYNKANNGHNSDLESKKELEAENDALKSDFTEKVKSLEDENAELRAELQRYSFTDEQLRPAKRGRPRTVPESTRQQVKDLRSQGHSVRKIAELLHVSNGFIMKVLKET